MTSSPPVRSSRSGSPRTTSPAPCARTAWPPPSAASSTRSPTPASRRTSAWSGSPGSAAATSWRPPALIMIIIGLIPKAGAIVASIPHPVLGGAALAMFATVAVVGIQTLSRVDFHDHRNVVIVGTSLGLAVYVTVQPDVAKAVPGLGADHLRQRHHPGQPRRHPAQLRVPPRGQEPRPGRRRAAGRHRRPRRGQPDEPRGVRQHVRLDLPGPVVGRRARLGAPAVLRHPGPAPRLPAGPVLLDRRAGARAHRGVPGPRLRGRLARASRARARWATSPRWA